jgi:hypothetical protein
LRNNKTTERFCDSKKSRNALGQGREAMQTYVVISVELFITERP